MQRILWSISWEFLTLMEMTSWILRSSWWPWIYPIAKQVSLTTTCVVIWEWVAAQAKLNWAFKLYDVDNDGVIDLGEMAVIMETMDDIDGVIPGNMEKLDVIIMLSQGRSVMILMVIRNPFLLLWKEQSHCSLLLIETMMAAWPRRSSCLDIRRDRSSSKDKTQMTRRGS